MKLKGYQPWIPSVLRDKVLVSSGAFQQRKKINRRVLPRCHRPPRPETLRWLHGGLWTSGTEDLPFCPDNRDWELGWASADMACSHLSHQKSLQLWNWMNWKNCTKKKKKRLWNMTKYKHIATCHIDSILQRSCRHYMHTYNKSSIRSVELALLWKHVCTHTRATIISNHK